MEKTSNQRIKELLVAEMKKRHKNMMALGINGIVSCYTALPTEKCVELLEYAEDLLEMDPSPETDLFYAQLMESLGVVCLNSGYGENAQNFLWKATDARKRLLDENEPVSYRSVAENLYGLSQSYSLSYDSDNMLECLRMALTYMEPLMKNSQKPSDLSVYHMILNEYFSQLVSWKFVEEAIPVGEQLTEFCGKVYGYRPFSETLKWAMNAETDVSTFYIDNKMHKEAARHLEIAMVYLGKLEGCLLEKDRACKLHHTYEQLAKSCKELGLWEQYLAVLEKLPEFYAAGLPDVKKYDNFYTRTSQHEKLERCYYEIAEACIQVNKQEKAESYAEKSLKLAHWIYEETMSYEAYHSFALTEKLMGQILMSQERYEAALPYWKDYLEFCRCFVLFRKSDAEENLIEALVEMGDLFKKLNQDQEADSCWKEALTRSETVDLTKHPNVKAAVERIQ